MILLNLSLPASGAKVKPVFRTLFICFINDGSRLSILNEGKLIATFFLACLSIRASRSGTIEE